MGVLLVEQHVNQALRYADRVYAMRRGAIVSGAQRHQVALAYNSVPVRIVIVRLVAYSRSMKTRCSECDRRRLTPIHPHRRPPEFRPLSVHLSERAAQATTIPLT